MGQAESKDDTQSKEIKTQKASPSKRVLGLALCNTQTIDFSCFGTGQNGGYRHVSWRKFIVHQLKSLNLEVWPELLIEHVKEYHDKQNDVDFQTDLLRVDFKCDNQTLHYSSKSMIDPIIKEDTFTHQLSEENLDANLNNDLTMNEQIVSGQSKESNNEESLKNFLEASDLLDENFFQNNDKECWLEKSFDFNCQEDTQNLAKDPFKFYSVISSPRLVNKSADQFRSLNFRRSTISRKKDQKSKAGSIAQSANGIQSPYTKFGKQPSLSPTDNKKPKKNNESAKRSVVVKQDRDYTKLLLHYKIITSLICAHLSQQKSIFNQLIKIFKDYFREKYTNKDDKILLSQTKEFVLKATMDLQQFIRIIAETLTVYYRLRELKINKKADSETLFTEENILNFATSIVFDYSIHEIIFSLYRTLTLSVEELYEKNLDRCQNLGPEEFAIIDEFCLDEKTIKAIREQKFSSDQNRQFENSVETFYFESSPKIKKEQPDFSLSPGIKSRSDSLANFEKNAQSSSEESYQDAIKMLATLAQKKSPMLKLKTIVKVAELVSTAIETFYRNIGSQTTKKIDSDQALAIFMFILVKSQMTDVLTHCRIIENFITKNILDSISGYYATTLEAAVNCVSSMNADDLNVEEACSMNSRDYNEIPNSLPNY